ncbi:Toxin co-regulated pilus biosynthesis protein Q [compost metagenome]
MRTVIKGWSQRVNYHVEWEPEDLDYPIDAPLRFEGSYEDALAGIFDLYKQADRSFIVDGHRKQKRVNVTEDHRKRNTRSPL